MLYLTPDRLWNINKDKLTSESIRPSKIADSISIDCSGYSIKVLLISDYYLTYL